MYSTVALRDSGNIYSHCHRTLRHTIGSVGNATEELSLHYRCLASISSSLYFVFHPLARQHLQIGDHEFVQVAVEDGEGVAGFVVGAVIFHHRVRLQEVGANLVAEGDVAVFTPADSRIRLLPVRCRCRSSRRAFNTRMALARFLIWLRSFWQVTTMPVGKWVMRMADSVLFTCWPPALLAR